MSASMAPTIKTGDIVVLGRSSSAPARVGDIVSIAVPEQIRIRFGYPPVVIHRIVRIDADGTVTTKGDAYKRARPVHDSAARADHQGRRHRAGRGPR